MTRASFVVVFALFPGCGAPDHEHAAPPEERPAVSVTRWTERTELFMEYPVLVAGERGRAAVHLTRLDDFSPLREGEAVVALRGEDGRYLEFRGGASRPGIFGVDLAPDRPGTYEMTVYVEAPGLEDAHEIGPVLVHSAGSAPATHDHGAHGEISFLKEQQWTLEFGTVLAEIRPLRPSVTVPGIVRPRAGGEAVLSAPVPGRIDPSPSAPVPGSVVPAGAILARIVPSSDDLRDAAVLRAELVEAEESHRLVLRERERAERLVEARALPARRLDEAWAAVAASEARLAAVRERTLRFEALSGSRGSVGGAFLVRAPFDGVVSEVRFASGGSVEEGAALLTIVDADRVHVVAVVPESSDSGLDSIEGGEIVLDGGPPIALSRPISVGRVVEPLARTIEVRFAFDNRTARLPVGRSVSLRLFTGTEAPGVAIPDSSIVDDAGRPVAFVQRGGESFERRPVRLGARAGGQVHVLEGIEPGERVVHRGAHLVRLAAMSSSIPAHGHVH